MNAPRPHLSISAVERDTGLGKDTLRAWERRYGFPSPARDDCGERLYPAEQVDRLRLIKRLIDQGHRPGRLVGVADADLVQLAARGTAATGTAASCVEGCAAPATAGLSDGQASGLAPLIERALTHIRAHDLPALQQTLNQALLRQGVGRFVIDTVGPLSVAVGEAWMRGEIEVFEEHLYTEQIKTLLRQSLSALPGMGAAPRVLLTTLPDELHTLGLLMVQSLLALEGATCIPLGAQTPLFDIRLAAQAHAADIVALSFSASFPSRQVAPLVSQLRGMLPPHVELWIGGGGAERARAAVAAAATGNASDGQGIRILPSLDSALQALEVWRSARG
ncbi:MerR family transcriptional regulator [Rhodocyclus tenuis]|uniref:MerR family transcriptional regulator n=1 Tax=Rhodocyclus tenuis TaxID=1066 RepID=A0A6L5K000_RHOTE|nr:MerR family transcriptional regulator [Rhodocyclus gracilis]MQY52729.1 MerR family transcriptional regulator [Rhodocyclus gracilis]MRD74113.1 MerR family transcriptional regulator [Rhodocyclus gracilis]